MSNESNIRQWKVIESNTIYKDTWITIRSDTATTGRGETIENYHVIEYPDCVNVIPVTTDGNVIIAREYRHGAAEIKLGLISGSVSGQDFESGGLAPERAARRELLEETGLVASKLEHVFTCCPNTAHQSNYAFTYLAFGIEKKCEPIFELGEEVELVYIPVSDLINRVQNGEYLMDAMHAAGLFAAYAYLSKRG